MLTSVAMHLELKTKHYQQPNRMAQWNIDQRLKRVHIAFHLCLLSGFDFHGISGFGEPIVWPYLDKKSRG